MYDVEGGAILGTGIAPTPGQYGPALVVQPNDFANALQHLEVRYAWPGILPFDPTIVPSVQVTATAPRATKVEGQSGAFTISRPAGDWSQPLTVYFIVRGTARPGSRLPGPGNLRHHSRQPRQRGRRGAARGRRTWSA